GAIREVRLARALASPRRSVRLRRQATLSWNRQAGSAQSARSCARKRESQLKPSLPPSNDGERQHQRQTGVLLELEQRSPVSLRRPPSWCYRFSKESEHLNARFVADNLSRARVGVGPQLVRRPKPCDRKAWRPSSENWFAAGFAKGGALADRSRRLPKA